MLLLRPAANAEFEELVQIGIVDNSPDEFSGNIPRHENTAFPGSATQGDNHYYLAGEYPSPVGLVGENENWSTNFGTAGG